MNHVVSFSGGKDSTAMLLMMLEKGMQIDRIFCVDTTKEFPQMYQHIEKVQKLIKKYDIKIEILKIDFDYYFSEHVKTKGKNIGKKGYGFPDFQNRWCTSLKREIVRKHLHHDDIQYHGIAFDEIERTKKNSDDIRYPLVDWKITEKQALDYCYSKGLDWGGLYEKFSRVSCWCCPLSRIGELKILYNEFPNLWNKLQDMDKKSFREFRSDYTLSELSQKFYCENLTPDMFVGNYES